MSPAQNNVHQLCDIIVSKEALFSEKELGKVISLTRTRKKEGVHLSV